MKAVEALGGLKLDVLGLRTLTILQTALHPVERETGRTVVLDDLPVDDELALAVFRRGETDGAFQFESSGMKEWLRKLSPETFGDLVAMNALYRRGPMDNIPAYIARRHGREPVESFHPLVDDALATTYGIPVYQEQVMQMAQGLGRKSRERDGGSSPESLEGNAASMERGLVDR